MKTREIIQPSSWNGKELTGHWIVTLKIDGIRAIWHDEHGWMSRAGKPLYNIPPWTGGPRDCEVYVGTFRDTIRATRTKHLQPETPMVLQEHLYGLDPLDTRLCRGQLTDPNVDDILAQLRSARSAGYEGVVMRQRDRWIKVKPEETHDVAITGFGKGTGKHAGRLCIVTTTRGDVGAGFSDDERTALWAEAEAGTLVGQVIEVSCMMITQDGMFRHPVFVRLRPDKLADPIPTIHIREKSRAALAKFGRPNS